MKDFYRSVRYLKPQIPRLIPAVICVILIAVLWGGGLGMALPAMKVLISDEGIHGWAWNELTQDKIGSNIKHRKVPPIMQKNFDLPETALRIFDIRGDRDKPGPARKAGLSEDDWIIHARYGPVTVSSSDALTRRIARTAPGATVTLAAFNEKTESVRDVTVVIDRPGRMSQWLGRIAEYLGEADSFEDRYPPFLYLLVVVGIMTVARNVLRFFQEYLVRTAVYRGMMDIRCDNFDAALHQPLTFFSEEGTTDTMSRFVQDINFLTRAHITLFGKTLVEPAKGAAVLLVAFYFSWEMTLIALIGGPVAYFLIRLFGKIMKKASRRALGNWSSMLSILQETLGGIRVVKAYAMEAAERRRFLVTNRRLYKQQRRIARVNAAAGPSVEVLGMFAAGGAAVGAGYMVFHEGMDPEIFISWMICLAGMYDPVRKLSKVATRFHQGDAAASRIFELHDREREKRTPLAPTLPRHREFLCFEHVSFTYPNRAAPAVCDINLDIRSGQTVSFVGPNGSGKTTLLSLLPRLLEPREGRILIDGKDISTHSVRSLRRQIALVTQENIIFNATIAENIAYGLRHPRPGQVEDAAERAFVTEFARNLPDGLDTLVGQEGAKLSGGQRQRIAIARAIIRDPAILIFDEALSQIDSESEQKIHHALSDFIQNRTTLMIAHRFSTIIEADFITVMCEGRILATGTHEQLLSGCGLYQQLCQTQFIGSEGKADDRE